MLAVSDVREFLHWTEVYDFLRIQYPMVSNIKKIKSDLFIVKSVYLESHVSYLCFLFERDPIQDLKAIDM